MKPETLLHNWNIPGIANLDNISLHQATSGLLNKTFLFRAGESGNDLFVLQAVHPAVSMDGAMENYFHVTHFLQTQDFVTQIMIPTNTGALWVAEPNTDWRWRLLRGIDGEIYTDSTNIDLAIEAGAMLGKVDAALANYPSQLAQGRQSHRYEREFEKLHEYQHLFAQDSDEQIREAAILLHSVLPQLLLPTDLPKSIIHADPKISNFVFNTKDKAICMIDFDTLQLHSPLFEIADAVRSWCGQQEDSLTNTFNNDIYRTLTQSYLANSKSLLSEQERNLIPQACKLVMVGLATRFINDYIDDSYFGWNETKYETRKAHNKARALGQISLYQSALKFL